MALPIERWAKQAALLGDITTTPPKRVADDLNDLVRYERHYWKMIDGRIAESGDPTALESLFGGLMAVPLASAGTASAFAVATETALWTPATYTPIPANSLMVPETFRLAATLNWTSTATASPTLILTPRLGTTVGGATLGASRAIPLTASITGAVGYIIGDITIRTIGDGATGGSALGLFHFASTNVAGGGATTIDELYGHTVGTFDSKAAQALCMGATTNPAGATTSFTMQQIHWMSWN